MEALDFQHLDDDGFTYFAHRILSGSADGEVRVTCAGGYLRVSMHSGARTEERPIGRDLWLRNYYEVQS